MKRENGIATATTRLRLIDAAPADSKQRRGRKGDAAVGDRERNREMGLGFWVSRDFEGFILGFWVFTREERERKGFGFYPNDRQNK